MNFDFDKARKTYGDFWDNDELLRMSLLDAQKESERKLNARIQQLEESRAQYPGRTL